MCLNNSHYGSVQYVIPPTIPNCSITMTVYPTVMHLVKTQIMGCPTMPETIKGARNLLTKIEQGMDYMSSLPSSRFTGFRQEIAFQGQIDFETALELADSYINRTGTLDGCQHVVNLSVQIYL